MRLDDQRRRSTVSVLRGQLLTGQVAFCGLLICCALVMPHVASSEGGVSNFGNHWSTLPLYSLAFAAVAVTNVQAARIVAKTTTGMWLESWALRVLAVLYLLVFASTFPRRIGAVWSQVHDDLGIALIGYEVVFTLFQFVRVRRLSVVVAAAVELVGAVIALLTILKVDHLLFVGQSVEALGFAAFIVIAIPTLFDQLAQGS